MTDKPRDLGDWQSAVDAYVAAGYSKEGAEAVLNQHCAIVASHKPPVPAPVAVAEPEPQPEPIVEDDDEAEQESEQKQDELDTEDAKEEEPV